MNSREMLCIVALLFSSKAPATEPVCTGSEIADDGNSVVSVEVENTDGEILINIKVLAEYNGLSLHQVLYRSGNDGWNLIVPLNVVDANSQWSTWILGQDKSLKAGQIVAQFGSPCPTTIVKNLNLAL